MELSQCTSAQVCWVQNTCALRAPLPTVIESLNRVPATLLTVAERPKAVTRVGAVAPEGTVHASAPPAALRSKMLGLAALTGPKVYLPVLAVSATILARHGARQFRQRLLPAFQQRGGPGDGAVHLHDVGLVGIDMEELQLPEALEAERNELGLAQVARKRKNLSFLLCRVACCAGIAVGGCESHDGSGRHEPIGRPPCHQVGKACRRHIGIVK